MTQKNILFITPVLPSLKKRGRNFRAYQWISHLQKNNYDVTVLCTSVYGSKDFRNDESPEKLNCKLLTSGHSYSTFKRIKNLLSLKPSTWNDIGGIIEKELNHLKITKPGAILCFRIQNASTALYLHQQLKTEEVWLDIDEVDSKVKYNIAERMKSAGYYLKAMKEYVEGMLYSFQESRLVSEFDTVFTSTKEELKYLTESNTSVKTEVFSNKLPHFKKQTQSKYKQGVFKFLFVGDSLYFPNLDAIDFLLFEILPGLKKTAKKPFNMTIVGGAIGSKQRRAIEENDSVTFYNDVGDLHQLYGETDAVIVPLKVGGGSSLKFLEALRYKKPVVATPVGSRGFDVKHGVHAMIARNSETIIEHCHALMRDPDLAREISENGHQWFLENHSFEVEMENDFETV